MDLKIKICTAYQVDGVEIDYFPFDINSNKVKPIYKELLGWDDDLTRIKNFSDLPKISKATSLLENMLEVPIEIVSVGPDRKQTIFKNENSL